MSTRISNCFYHYHLPCYRNHRGFANVYVTSDVFFHRFIGRKVLRSRSVSQDLMQPHSSNSLVKYEKLIQQGWIQFKVALQNHHPSSKRNRVVDAVRFLSTQKRCFCKQSRENIKTNYNRRIKENLYPHFMKMRSLLNILALANP